MPAAGFSRQPICLVLPTRTFAGEQHARKIVDTGASRRGRASRPSKPAAISNASYSHVCSIPSRRRWHDRDPVASPRRPNRRCATSSKASRQPAPPLIDVAQAAGRTDQRGSFPGNRTPPMARRAFNQASYSACGDIHRRPRSVPGARYRDPGPSRCRSILGHATLERLTPRSEGLAARQRAMVHANAAGFAITSLGMLAWRPDQSWHDARG